jgi:hypothetical protein
MGSPGSAAGTTVIHDAWVEAVLQNMDSVGQKRVRTLHESGHRRRYDDYG